MCSKCYTGNTKNSPFSKKFSILELSGTYHKIVKIAIKYLKNRLEQCKKCPKAYTINCKWNVHVAISVEVNRKEKSLYDNVART